MHEIVQPTVLILYTRRQFSDVFVLQNHRYVLQGTVLRDSWDVKESAVAFVKLQRAGQMRQKAKISQTHGHDKEKDGERFPSSFAYEIAMQFCSFSCSDGGRTLHFGG